MNYNYLEEIASLQSASANMFRLIYCFLVQGDSSISQVDLIRKYGFDQSIVSRVFSKLRKCEVIVADPLDSSKYLLENNYRLEQGQNHIVNEIEVILKMMNKLKPNDFRVVSALIAAYYNNNQITSKVLLKKYNWNKSSLSLAIGRLQELSLIEKTGHRVSYLPHTTKGEEDKKTLRLKVMHWNINAKNRSVSIPDMVKENIGIISPDLFVLTEVRKVKNYSEFKQDLVNMGYRIFEDQRILSDTRSISRVLIGLRNESEFKNISPVITLPDNKDLYAVKEANPNYLQVNLSYANQKLAIIGSRIRIANDNAIKDRERRKQQLENLLKSIPNERKVVVLGDFNISPDYCFNKKNWDYKLDYKKKIIQKELVLNVPNYGTSPYSSSLRLDHMLTSNEILIYSEPEYFAQNEWTNKEWQNRVEKNNDNLPDHAIFFAGISV